MLKLNRTQIHEVAQKAQIQLKEGTTPEIVKENIKTEVETMLHKENTHVTSIRTLTSTDITANTSSQTSKMGPDISTHTLTTTMCEAEQIKNESNMVIDVVNSEIDNPAKRLSHLYSVLEEEYHFLDLDFLLCPLSELPVSFAGLVMCLFMILKIVINNFTYFNFVSDQVYRNILAVLHFLKKR